MPDDKNVQDSEFTLSRAEVDAPLDVGDFGSLLVPVEVISIHNGLVTFRKHGPAKASEPFKPESLDQMRDRMGTVNPGEEEIPMAGAGKAQ